MNGPPSEWQTPAAAPTPAPAGDMAPVLAHALRLGLRYYARQRARGAEPPEVRAMAGALQQYERELRRARDARVVARW